MLPTLRHRVLILLAVVIGGLVWLLAAPALTAADGGAGFSLLTGRGGFIGTSLMVLLLGLPVLAMGLVLSASGHPLSGIFAVATALCFLAGRGGPIDDWLRRAADSEALPGAYVGLIGEMFIWQIGVVLMFTAIAYLRSPLRARMPALAYDDHLGVDVHLTWPAMQTVLAGVMAAVVAGVIAYFLLRSSDTTQVMWSLIFAFAVGSCAGHLTFPHTNPVGILLSPAIVAVLAYTWMVLSGNFNTTSHVLVMWHSIQYRTPLPAGLALALPIHYTSAGLVGCTLGVGLAHILEASKPAPVADAQP